MLPACATVLKGSTQDISVNSTPTAASCTVAKGAAQVAVIPATPGIVKLNRGSDDTIVTCNKPGFDQTAVTMKSSFNGATFGNILLGGVVGVVVDASTGANYTYQESVTVVLPPSAGATVVVPGTLVPGPYRPGEPIRLAPQQPGV